MFNQHLPEFQDYKETEQCSLLDEPSVVCNFELTDELISEAKHFIDKDKYTVSEFQKHKLLEESSRNWDLFYKRNKDNFFKDRTWLEREFPELRSSYVESDLTFDGSKVELTAKRLLIDIGCGVGNATIPLLLNNSNFEAICIDCSKIAIDLLKKRWDYLTTPENKMIPQSENEKEIPQDITDNEKGTINNEISVKNLNNVITLSPRPGNLRKAVVFDITKTDPFPEICEEPIADAVFLLFCLSAIDPKHHSIVAQRAAKILKPGGILFFRDYGRYDMAQVRFAKAMKSKLQDNFYVRYDGTFAYYFDLDELKELFSLQAGLQEIENKYHLREFTNRKTNVKMSRIWIQAKFKKI